MGTKHYYRQDKDNVIKLPTRWLAPESMQDYVFSEKSDVVSEQLQPCHYSLMYQNFKLSLLFFCSGHMV